MDAFLGRPMNRRAMLGKISAGIAALPLAYFARPLLASSSQVPSDLVLPEDTKEHPWKIALAGESEPGHPMIVSGRVFEADGATPRAGIRVYAYHTDNRGFYAADGNFTLPRLHGTMWTNAEGRYEFRSIKPAPYPGRAIPAHIHFLLFFPDGRRVEPDELRFDGDPLLKPEDYSKGAQDGTFSSIRPVVRGGDGVLHCVRDFKLPRG
jgi:protocatechuate 3,4-dioxygenase, beta subunit